MTSGTSFDMSYLVSLRPSIDWKYVVAVDTRTLSPLVPPRVTYSLVPEMPSPPALFSGVNDGCEARCFFRYGAMNLAQVSVPPPGAYGMVSVTRLGGSLSLFPESVPPGERQPASTSTPASTNAAARVADNVDGRIGSPRVGSGTTRGHW